MTDFPDGPRFNRTRCSLPTTDFRCEAGLPEAGAGRIAGGTRWKLLWPAARGTAKARGERQTRTGDGPVGCMDI